MTNSADDRPVFTEKEKEAIRKMCKRDFDWDNLSDEECYEIDDAASDELALYGFKGEGMDIEPNEYGNLCIDIMEKV